MLQSDMLGEAQRGQLGKRYFGIPVKTLCPDTMTDFDLYLPPEDGKVPVLYREHHLVITQEVLDRLSEHRVETLFIDSTQEAAYEQYIESHLGDILRDDKIRIEEKSNLLYSSAQNLVKQIMEEPRAGEMLPRAKNVVVSTVDFMLREKTALENLLKVTSFDYYTYTHSVNVFVFSVSLAQRIGWDDTDALRVLGLGALLHDVGKSQLDPGLIRWRGKLNDYQWAQMKQHPAMGERILRERGDVPEEAIDVVRHHHEKLTGTGYPDGLRDHSLSAFARIATIADIFDALTTERTYKSAIDSYPALKLMHDEMANELDPDLFKAMVFMMGNPSNW